MARKPKHMDEWGRAQAKSRYGGGSATFGNPPDGGVHPQSNQAPEDKHASIYDNDVPLSGWLRGKDATKKPGFAKPWDKR